jgi:hypothetical protein
MSMDKPITLKYAYAYTTSGGAHRYNPVGKPAINIGNLYLRGVVKPPRALRVTVEGMQH